MAGYARNRVNVFFERGQHATSICGTIGAAVAAGLLYGLDAAGIGHAIGIAASMGAGILEANRTGGSVKQAHCGWAAHAGVSAAVLAADGLTGPPTVLEGRFGFFTAHTGRLRPPTRCCAGWARTGRCCAPSTSRTRRITSPTPASTAPWRCAPRARPGRRRRDRAGGGRPGTAYHRRTHRREDPSAQRVPREVLRPVHDRGGAARRWRPGAVARRFVGELAADRLALAARVRCVADPRASELFPRAFAAVLRVRTRGGALLEHRVDSSRGGPQHPLSAADLATKFQLNAERAVPPARIAALRDAVLGTGVTPSALLALTAPAR